MRAGSNVVQNHGADFGARGWGCWVGWVVERKREDVILDGVMFC